VPMISIARHPQVGIAAILAISCGAIGAGSAGRTLLDFWHVGDDALSIRLAERVEGAFLRSPDFTMSSGKKPGTLVVTIPTNVDWSEKTGRTRLHFEVKFTSVDNRSLGSGQGSCWETALDECADRIVSDARIAARKNH
jgi:hypothetical protein